MSYSPQIFQSIGGGDSALLSTVVVGAPPPPVPVDCIMHHDSYVIAGGMSFVAPTYTWAAAAPSFLPLLSTEA